MSDFAFSDAINIIKKKWKLIIAINIIFLVIGSGIAISHKELWRSDEIIKNTDASYNNPLYRAYIEIIQYNNKESNSNLFDNKYLLNVFISLFNSDMNKMKFLNLSDNDEKIKEKLNKIAYRENKNGYYTLQYSSSSKLQSKELLRNYINYTKENVIRQVTAELSSLKDNTLDINKQTLTNEIKKAEFIKGQKIARLNQAFVITQETNNKDLKDGIVLDSNENTSLIMLGSDVLAKYISEAKNKKLAYFNSKINEMENNIDNIKDIKLSAKGFDFYEIVSPAGISFERYNISKSRIIILFLFIGILASLIYIIACFRMESK
ncbi:Wzz/FepE/Etk N-terminal domain-containing protein [Photobacterium damselae]|uniref:Wzz/FepE/Etk N-terminal domain-containing protein n=1 Tax=Photobacterium damselae TaxID=38293 RepID=UPI004068CD82